LILGKLLFIINNMLQPLFTLINITALKSHTKSSRVFNAKFFFELLLSRFFSWSIFYIFFIFL